MVDSLTSCGLQEVWGCAVSGGLCFLICVRVLVSVCYVCLHYDFITLTLVYCTGLNLLCF